MGIDIYYGFRITSIKVRREIWLKPVKTAVLQAQRRNSFVPAGARLK
jgi:hypothetical protein